MAILKKYCTHAAVTVVGLELKLPAEVRESQHGCLSKCFFQSIEGNRMSGSPNEQYPLLEQLSQGLSNDSMVLDKFAIVA